MHLSQLIRWEGKKKVSLSTVQTMQTVMSPPPSLSPYLRECTIVPDVSMMREAVADVAGLVVLDILLDGVEGFLLADFQFCVGPARDLDDHVENLVGLISVERDIMEGRDGSTIAFCFRGTRM